MLSPHEAGVATTKTHSPSGVIAQDDFPGLVVVIETRNFCPVGRNAASNNAFRSQAENLYVVFLRDRYGVAPAIRRYRWESLSIA